MPCFYYIMLLSLGSVLLVIIVLFALSRRGGKKSSHSVVIYKPERQVGFQQPPYHPKTEKIHVTGPAETILSYIIVGLLFFAAASSWIDGDKIWAIAFVVFALGLLFIHFSWPYFAAIHPPRNEDEKREDERNYKNRNAIALLALILLAYLVIRLLLHVPSNVPFF